MNFKLIVVFLLVLSLLSCKEQQEKRRLKKLYEQNIGKQVDFNELKDSLEFLNISKDGFYNFGMLSEYKIVTQIDANCEKCISRINNDWASFLAKVNKDQVQAIFIIYTKRPRYFKEIILPDIEDCGIFIIDTRKYVFNHYQIPHDFIFQTFILDEKNEIISFGDPSLNNAYAELLLDKFAGKIE